MSSLGDHLKFMPGKGKVPLRSISTLGGFRIHSFSFLGSSTGVVYHYVILGYFSDWYSLEFSHRRTNNKLGLTYFPHSEKMFL